MDLINIFGLIEITENAFLILLFSTLLGSWLVLVLSVVLDFIESRSFKVELLSFKPQNSVLEEINKTEKIGYIKGRIWKNG
jgi:hypothetical protein